MSHGVERRAQVDIETLKTLLLINGDGAVSLLAIFHGNFIGNFKTLLDLATSKPCC
jgi:hypothetical protein